MTDTEFRVAQGCQVWNQEEQRQAASSWGAVFWERITVTMDREAAYPDKDWKAIRE